MSMQTAEEIMNKHFKECFETHNETISEKYILYFHKAMKEYAKQESEKAVREYKDKLIDELDSGISLDTSYVYYAELVGLIENTK